MGRSCFQILYGVLVPVFLWLLLPSQLAEAQTGHLSLMEKGQWVRPQDLFSPEDEEPPGEEIKPVEGAFCVPLEFPGRCDIECRGPLDLRDAEDIFIEVDLPETAPKDVQVSLYVKDQDHLWYQSVNRDYLIPGQCERRVFSMDPRTNSWEPKGHVRSWDRYHLGAVKSLGIRLQSSQTFQGEAKVGPVACTTGSVSSIPVVQGLSVSSPSVQCHEIFEISFSLAKTYSNPFDPEVISVMADFRSPSGKLLTIPAFLHQSYFREKHCGKERLWSMGETDWRVRFCPTEVGQYTYSLRIDDGQEIATKPRSFEACPGADPGFVRVDQDKKGFEFASGSSFYPVGHVIRSDGDDRMAYDYDFEVMNGLGTYAYDAYFAAMQAEGVNFCRIWMCSWWLAMEWAEKWSGFRGVGRYNLENAWRVDHILSEARKKGIYVELTLTNHGQWSPHIDTEWANNPYNVDNGGFLKRPDDFFYDPEARKLTRQRHRYCVARWAASPHLMAWALFSEVDWVAPYFRSLDNPANGDRAIVADWHRDMAQLLRSVDPWCHMITTQFAFPNRGGEVWALPEMDYVQANGYTGYPLLNAKTAPQAFLNYYYNFVAQYQKPVMVGEYGGHWEENTPDELNVQLHTGCWGAFMMPLAGFGGYWWWPYIHNKNLYGQMGALARFAEGEDRRGVSWDLIQPAVRCDGNVLVSQGIKTSNRAYLWVAHQLSLVQTQGISTIQGGQVTLEGLLDGVYEIEFWDTYTGRPTGTIIAGSAQGQVVIDLPAVDKDLALKVKIKGEG